MFKGLVTMITGGASALGRATAENLIKQGSRVVICDLPNTNVSKFAKKLGDSALFVPLDVTSEKEVLNALQVTKDKFGKLDVSINCAGMALANQINFKKKDPFDHELLGRVIDIDVVGTFNVVRLAAGLIGKNIPDEDQLRGLIINVASPAAFEGESGWDAYIACRAAIGNITLPIARDFGNQGIRVMSIIPEVFRIKENLKEPTEEVFPSGKNYPKDFAFVIDAIIENPMMNADVIRLDQYYEQSLF